MDLARLAVAFQVGSCDHRGCEGHPREIVAICRGQGYAAVLGRLDYHAFIHETVVEAGIPCKDYRTAYNRLMPVLFEQMWRKVQREFDAVTFLPFAFYFRIFAC